MTGKLCWESSRLQQWTDGWWCCSVVIWHAERSDVVRCALWWWTWHITQAVIMWEPGGNELEDNSEISSRQCVKTRQFEACINTHSSEIINSVAINTKPSGCHVSLIWICKWSLCWKLKIMKVLKLWEWLHSTIFHLTQVSGRRKHRWGEHGG